MPNQDILRLQVTMYDLMLLQKVQRAKHLLGETPDQLDGEATESIGFDELVEVHVEKLCRDAEMTTEVEAMCEIHHAVLVLGVLLEFVSEFG